MAKKTSERVSATVDFEKALAELERLVEQLEQGDIGLEQALQHFERGIELTRACQDVLQNAEQKVEQLIEKHGRVETIPFEPQD